MKINFNRRFAMMPKPLTTTFFEYKGDYIKFDINVKFPKSGTKLKKCFGSNCLFKTIYWIKKTEVKMAVNYFMDLEEHKDAFLRTEILRKVAHTIKTFVTEKDVFDNEDYSFDNKKEITDFLNLHYILHDDLLLLSSPLTEHYTPEFFSKMVKVWDDKIAKGLPNFVTIVSKIKRRDEFVEKNNLKSLKA